MTTTTFTLKNCDPMQVSPHTKTNLFDRQRLESEESKAGIWQECTTMR